MSMFDILVMFFIADITLSTMASIIIIYLFFADRIQGFIDRVKKHNGKHKRK